MNLRRRALVARRVACFRSSCSRHGLAESFQEPCRSSCISKGLERKERMNERFSKRLLAGDRTLVAGGWWSSVLTRVDCASAPVIPQWSTWLRCIVPRHAARMRACNFTLIAPCDGLWALNAVCRHVWAELASCFARSPCRTLRSLSTRVSALI